MNNTANKYKRTTSTTASEWLNSSKSQSAIVFCDQYRHHYDYHHPAITISFLSTCCVSAYFNHELLFIRFFFFISLYLSPVRFPICLTRFEAHNDICVLPHRWMSSNGKTFDPKMKQNDKAIISMYRLDFGFQRP